MNVINDWIEISEDEKRQIERISNSMPPSAVTFFNLQSDKGDCASRFPEMSREDVVRAATESAAWLMNENHNS